MDNIIRFISFSDRITIRENVDLIRLQKQLSEKGAALRVTQEKFTHLQEVSQLDTVLYLLYTLSSSLLDCFLSLSFFQAFESQLEQVNPYSI